MITDIITLKNQNGFSLIEVIVIVVIVGVLTYFAADRILDVISIIPF